MAAALVLVRTMFRRNSANDVCVSRRDWGGGFSELSASASLRLCGWGSGEALVIFRERYVESSPHVTSRLRGRVFGAAVGVSESAFLPVRGGRLTWGRFACNVESWASSWKRIYSNKQTSSYYLLCSSI